MIYLDNAATTFPKPRRVYEQPIEFLRTSGGNPGRGGHYFSSSSAQTIETARREVAHFFGVPDIRRVIFAYNCTDAINIVLKGLLSEGDHVIASNLDHNAVSRPLVSRPGIEVTRLEFSAQGMLDPDQARKNIRHNTRLIVLTHGSNVLGSIQRLDAFLQLVSEADIPLLLDAAQTAGRVPIVLGKAPVFLACSGHKGLFGFPGIGILIVPENFSLRKWREGGSGTASESLTHPDELPMRLEAGTPNVLGIASVIEGIRFIEEEGIEKIHMRERNLAQRLANFLRNDSRFQLYSSSEAGDSLAIVSFNIQNVSGHEVAAILDQNFSIAVRAGLHCAAVLHDQLGTSPEGCVRVSPGYFNTEEEIDSLINALREICEAY